MLTEDLVNKGKLKVLVRALKEIIEELESELYDGTESYKYENYKEMTPQSDDDYDEVFQLSPEVYKKQYEFQDVINFDMDDIKNMSNKKKKVKGQSKLSQDEIKNLSTDELLSYIESEGKAKKQ